MTALQVLEQVLAEIGFTKESPELSGSDEDILKIRQFINETGKEIAIRGEWRKLVKNVNLSGGIGEAILPSDFLKMPVYGAMWCDNTLPVIRCEDISLWQYILRNLSSRYYYVLQNGNILFNTVMPDAVRYRYLSKNWVDDDKDEVTENGDSFLIPEQLLVRGAVWRWKREIGLQYEDERQEYEALIITHLNADRNAA